MNTAFEISGNTAQSLCDRCVVKFFVKYDENFASRWRAKSPDALCAVLPSVCAVLPYSIIPRKKRGGNHFFQNFLRNRNSIIL